MIGSKRTKRIFQIASTIGLLAAATACDSPDRDHPELEPESWPADLVTPIPGATFSLAESDFPGAPSAYHTGTRQGFAFFNGRSGRPLAADKPVVAIADGEIVRIDRAYEEPGVEKRAYYAEISAEPGFIGEFALDQLRGRQVWIRHQAGHVSRYAHLSEVHPELQPGDEVQQGQPIGLMGNTGIPPTEDQPSPAPHLHFELWSPDGSAYMGQDLTPLESHRLIAQQFGPDALPRYARRIVTAAAAGEPLPETYPPAELPETGFNVNPPASPTAGTAFSIPVTWDGDDFMHQDFFALLEDQPLGIVDAGNGAWILGAVPLGAEATKLNLIVGAADPYGQTLVGKKEIATAKPDRVMVPLEVPGEIFELYSEENLQLEAQALGPAMLRSLEIKEALWDESFNAPVSGDVIRRFGQQIVHAMLRPAHPLGGVNVAAEPGAPVLATNAGRVALVEDLPIRGKTIALIHGGGVVSVYAHLSEATVQAGDTVTRGQPIGAAGQSGAASRPMLRWEMYTAGIASDPLTWLDQTLPGRSDARAQAD